MPEIWQTFFCAETFLAKKYVGDGVCRRNKKSQPKPPEPTLRSKPVTRTDRDGFAALDTLFNTTLTSGMISV